MSHQLVQTRVYQPQPVQGEVIPASAGINDSQLIELWLFDKSPSFQKKAIPRLKRCLNFIKKPLRQISLEDLQAFVDSLNKTDLKPGSIKNFITTFKSLFKFGHKLGYLPVNVSALIKTPKLKKNLAERIVSSEKILQMIALETNVRNRLILKLLYATGIRAAEICTLKWKDVQKRGDGKTQINVFGKGSRTRSILLPQSIVKELLNFRGNAQPDAPVFHSRKSKYGGHLHISTLEKIVKAARERAGIEEEVSPHWFRHSHATHSLEQGAPIHLVRETLGHSSIKITEVYLHVRPEDSSSRFLVD